MALNSENENLVARLITATNASLRLEVEELRRQLQDLTQSTTVVDYKIEVIDPHINCDESLEVVKSLPEFNGKQTKYVSWRESANNAMSLYVRGSRRYFAALTILRNKITNDANDILSNHGTVLNFDAILARLDFAYADKRPAHIIEQEMSILRQGTSSIIEYYNKVNEKLTLLINKTIMTYGSDNAVTKELNAKNRRDALRIFITGLNGNLANIIFSLSPSDLPNALAKAQELESNNMRAIFASQFGKNPNYYRQRTNINNGNFNNNLRFPQTQLQRGYNQRPLQQNIQARPIPMDVDPSTRIQNRPHYNVNNTSNVQNTRIHTTDKRPYASAQISNQPPNKTQRINNIKEDHFLDQN